MPDYYLPSEHDKQLLQWVINEVRKRVTDLGTPQMYPVIVTNTDCYIAKLPDDGIPARSGTVPGYASCEIWKIVDDSSSYSLENTGVEAIVFNLAEETLVGNYVPVTRDKFGSWIAGSIGSGESAGTGTCVGGVGGVTWGEMEIVDPTAVDPDDPGHLLYVDPITGCLKLFPIFPCN